MHSDPISSASDPPVSDQWLPYWTAQVQNFGKWYQLQEMEQAPATLQDNIQARAAILELPLATNSKTDTSGTVD